MATDLTNGPVAGHLRRQATPMAFGLIAIISFDAVDLFFVSRLGDAPLAAISFTFPVIWFLSSLGIGFEAGAASCISRAVGKNDHALAKRMTTDTVVLAFLFASVCAGIGLVTIEPLFTLLGATPEVIPLIDDYISIWYLADPIATAMWVCLATVRARGNSLLEGKVITAAAVLNAGLDPILIFGMFGVPAFGIAGAAIASLLANLIMLTVTLVHLHFRLQVFASPIARFSTIVDSWRQVMVIGLPAMVTNAIVPVANGVVVALIASFGVQAVAGFGVGMRMEPFVLVAFYALSAVSSPFAGQNFSAARFDRLREQRQVITRFTLLFGLAMGVLMVVIAPPLTGIFSEDPEIRSIAVDYLRIMAFSYGSYGLVMAVNASFNGMGFPMPGLVLSALRVFVLFLPLALIGKWLLGLNGLFIGGAIANLVVAFIGWQWLGKRIEVERLKLPAEAPFAS